MTLKPFAAVALAALLTLTALSTPMAEARVCHPRVRVDVETYGEVPVPSEVGVKYPPHWDRFAFAQNTKLEGSYSNGCVEAGGSVGGVSTSGLSNELTLQADDNGDGMGDAWVEAWWQRAGQLLQPLVDTDDDGLLNVDEFRWQHTPVCAAGFGNCVDHDADALGGNGDDWQDGPEVHYWNNDQNDAINPGTGVAVFDPDRLIDTDGDLVSNVNDTDSDDDGLIDGEEYHAHGTYPEYADSDCEATAVQCKPSRQTRFFDPNRPGNPGTGDLLADGDELAYWTTINGLTTDYDGDGIASNLLDADSDGDSLVDGEEVTVWDTKPYLLDSDLDGLDDGLEVRVHHTDPARWDTDDDGMPDGWEADRNMDPLVDDAGLDNDADVLTNLGEYQYDRPSGWAEATQGPWNGGTNPSDPDTEGDALLDGEEALTHGTDPFHWDSDVDGMADFFEVTHRFDPLGSWDASDDADADSFDQGDDGSIQMPWPNLHEYRYGRPVAWDEVAAGPWRSGTNPVQLDTDGDGSGDGQEAYFGTDARVPADVLADDDQDGLNWADEARLGLNPSDPDSDGDGLCDGSRGANCHFPDRGSAGNMPGEADYGSIAWEPDSDADGRSDSQEARKWDSNAAGQALDVDGDHLNGVIDADSDNDGLTDGDELARTTDQALPDTDTDGLTDGSEVRRHLTDPKDSDHDNDGLLDGEEILVHGTDAHAWDTDWDGLADSVEVEAHGTNPLAKDTDRDAMFDGWEVWGGTQAKVPDAEIDVDGDALANAREHRLGSHPNRNDTDADGLPDAYEAEHGLGITSWTRTWDPDADGLGNIDELRARTHPRVADSDGDGRSDGWEANVGSTDPLDPDTDKDGLNDGPEYEAWVAGSHPWHLDLDGDRLNGLQDPDSDNDGLTDRDELVGSRTRPWSRDTDGDSLSDYEEVVVYGGRFDPRRQDTDGDGNNDNVAAAMLGPNGDPDEDGLTNADEAGYGTNPDQADTDCDGINDGPELNHWEGAAGNLLVPDVDGDGILDGIEIGPIGTPSQGVYRTRPDMADTDLDGIGDGGEARNNADIVCDEPVASMTHQVAAVPALPPPGPAPSLLAGLTRTATGLYVGQDEDGWYVQGGYAVKLYLGQPLPSTATPEQVAQAMTRPMATGGPGSNGKLTDPLQWDTDSDGLSDGAEATGSRNPYGNEPTDPLACDSDGDGLGDGIELGVGSDVAALWFTPLVCQQRDRDPGSLSNPVAADTDGDGIPDGTLGGTVGEDANNNGLAELLPDPFGYCGMPGSESSSVDLDSDDDGVADNVEVAGVPPLKPTSPWCFDSDGDRMSDGLELGVKWEQRTAQTRTDATRSIAGHSVLTFQPSASGRVLNPMSFDADGDGIPDGLEDLDLDGLFGLAEAETDPTILDSDLDGLIDGREVLLYGLGVHGNPIAETLTKWGGDVNRVKYDAANPWVTNPLLGNTDEPSGPTDAPDDVPDGRDLNPRGDAFFALGLDGFRMLTAPDGADDHPGAKSEAWDMELYIPELTVQLPLSNAQYVIQLKDTDNVPLTNTKGLQTLPANLLNKLEEPGKYTTTAALGQAWRVDSVASGNLVQFNLPEEATSLDPNGEMAITVTIHLADDDGWPHPNSCCLDDDIDLDPTNGHGKAVHKIKLGEDVKGTLNQDGRGLREDADENFLVWQDAAVEHRGRDSGAESSENGLLQVKAADSVPKHFLEGLQQVLRGKPELPTGTCHGEASCVR